MAFSPNSTVYLLDTPLDNTYKNQLYFSSTTSQKDYFDNHIKHRFDDVTYQRKDNTIQVNKNIDDLWNVNYVMYQNANFTYKWFYAFITKMEYVNANTTKIFIETDVYQTWLSECTLKKSFVVREHVTDDARGHNLVEENLEYGDYIAKTSTRTNKLTELAFVVAHTPITETTIPAEGFMYGRVYSGVHYVTFPTTETLTSWLQGLGELGKSDIVQCIFTIPKALLPLDGTGSISNNLPPNVLEWSYNKSFSQIDGYTPKNNKLYNFPYNVFYVSNNQGVSANYRFEDFDENNNFIEFEIVGNIAPSPTVMICPKGYKGRTARFMEYGVSMEGFPLCSWLNDTYTAWLAQNSASLGVTTAINVGAIMASPITAVGGAVGIAQQMAQVAQHQVQPYQAKGNVNGGSLNVSLQEQDFYMCHMTIKAEYAQRIDEYFSMYGYKVNTVKVPNVNTRPHWNYVQTIDVNIDGAIPTEDMTRLKQMYNEGVTFWKNPSEFCNYSLDNSI